MPSTPSNQLQSPEGNIWYLAYGSNLSSSTFRKRRGIHPLAEVNVIVPSLELTFDLAVLPYWEPCVANVRMRKDESEGRHQKDITMGISELEAGRQRMLMGVAYLVTQEDFARIMATEGGGSVYEKVEVDCWQIHRDKRGEETTREGERLIVSTLLAPDSKRRLTPIQPSKRYIDIIRAGAREHEMPPSYITYLDNIPYYHITSLRQRIGAILFLAAWLPALFSTHILQRLLTDSKTGRSPKWVGTLVNLTFSTMWKNYDVVWKTIFGSGEVTAMVGNREENVK